jgi:hypothetical protein
MKMEPSKELVQIESRRSPHINRSIDNTALAQYMECPRKFYYGMVLNRRKGGLSKPALSYGTTWHTILETHYKTGGDYAAVKDAAVASWQPHDNPDDHRTLERALKAYVGYLNRWGDHEADSRGNGATVGFPNSPVVELATELWWEGAIHPYAGKIDRVFELQGLYYVEDHKTTSALGANYFYQFDPSNQMMGYAVLAQELTGLPIAGVRINAHGVLKTQDKFERKIVTYSQPRLAEWKHNYNMWVGRLENSMALLKPEYIGNEELSMGVRDEDRVLLEAFPHQFNACAAKYGMCQYAEVCTSPPHLRKRIIDFEYEEEPWDPMHSADEGGAE